MDDLKLLTVADVAERLGAATSTVTLWCRRGLFPNAIRGPKTGSGAIWLILESDLTDFERPKVGYPKGRPRSGDNPREVEE